MASITASGPSPKPMSLAEPVSYVGKIPSSKPESVVVKRDTADYMLSSADVNLYKQIFVLQRKGKWDKADEKIELLQDKRLLGYVEYLRYMHPTAYRSEYTELRSWLDKYSDHHGAKRLYELAVSRRPADYRAPAKPSISLGTRGSLDRFAGVISENYISNRKRTAAQQREIRRISRVVKNKLSKGHVTNAWEYLNTEKNRDLFDKTEFDELRADIAQNYYLHDHVDDALTHAREAVMRSGTDVPVAGWTAGLASWRQGGYSDAAAFFETVAETRRASPWMISGGAYWAARAHHKIGNRKETVQWLKKATKYSYTFYGLLAGRALGNKAYGFNWTAPEFNDKHFAVLADNKIGRRVVGLLQISEYDLAEKELRQLNVYRDEELKNAVVSIAQEWNMPALAMQLGSALTHDNGNLMDSALYPIIPWKPKGGFEIDQALVNAFIRQESRFDPNAVSHSGAVGLMQLMPTTASYVAGENANTFKSRSGQRRLLKPEYNIALGQKYIATLMRDNRINEDLFKLTIAYNAGPSRMARWEREIDYKDDPLLFIESIPAAETRMFVERVLANYWIYRIRLGQDLPSMEAVVKDQWPLYASQDKHDRMQVALTNSRYQ
ncbi:MAG: lytic transglycosylase domain-containing protein [Pseudomonadota bacterium]